MAAYPTISSLKTAEDFLRRLAGPRRRNAVRRRPPAGRAAGATHRRGRPHHRQPLLHPADGRLGRRDRRPAERADGAALAAVRGERRQADLGRRGRGRAPRRPGHAERIAHRPKRRCPAWPPSAKRLIDEHRRCHGRTDDLLVGLQLTHSGRFAGPNERGRYDPILLYHHPILDRKFRVPDGHPVLTDDEIARLVDDFVQAARRAQRVGFDFVDVKHCHGYLGHEFLSAVDRPGRYGGDFENRTRFLREVVAGVRAEAPGLAIGVRLSAVDWIPFRKGPDGRGEPEPFAGAYRHAFGGDGSGVGIDLTEPLRFLDLLASLDIRLAVHVGRQPVLQPAHPAAGPVPAVGRLPAAGRPAGRRRPADRRRGRDEAARAAAGGGRLGIFLLAGVVAERGPGGGADGRRRTSSGWGGWR